MSTKSNVGPGWFRIAVQALVLIASSKEPCSSTTIALDVSAHAVFLRRVLAQLVRGGIVKAREGRAGGYVLARPADRVPLADVYRAVKLANPPEVADLGDCQSARVATALDDIEAEIEQRLLQVLEQHTIADIIERSSALVTPEA